MIRKSLAQVIQIYFFLGCNDVLDKVLSVNKESAKKINVPRDVNDKEVSNAVWEQMDKLLNTD